MKHAVALQLVADHPTAVRRLVIASSAYRLDRSARVSQMNYAEATAAGQRSPFAPDITEFLSATG